VRVAYTNRDHEDIFLELPDDCIPPPQITILRPNPLIDVMYPDSYFHRGDREIAR
jgi:hypothetical protein